MSVQKLKLSPVTVVTDNKTVKADKIVGDSRFLISPVFNFLRSTFDGFWKMFTTTAGWICVLFFVLPYKTADPSHHTHAQEYFPTDFHLSQAAKAARMQTIPGCRHHCVLLHTHLIPNNNIHPKNTQKSS